MPTFKLEWAELPDGPDDSTVLGPTPEDVDAILKVLSEGDSGFVILSTGEQRYIQATPSDEGVSGPIRVEYRDGDEDSHFEIAESIFGARRLQELFRVYLKDPASIGRAAKWAPLEL